MTATMTVPTTPQHTVFYHFHSSTTWRIHNQTQHRYHLSRYPVSDAMHKHNTTFICNIILSFTLHYHFIRTILNHLGCTPLFSSSSQQRGGYNCWDTVEFYLDFCFSLPFVCQLPVLRQPFVLLFSNPSLAYLCSFQHPICKTF